MAIPFLVDAISYVISVISLSAIKQRLDNHQQSGKINLLQDISIGLQWLWTHQSIRYLAFLSAFLNLIFSGSLLAVIVLAMRLHASTAVTGIILSIGSTGTLLGAFLIPSLQQHFPTGRIIIAATFLSGVCWVVQSVVLNPFFFAPIGIVMLSCMTIYNILVVTYLIKQIPDELRGRVSSVFRLIAFGTRLIGLLIIGGLLNSIGPVITMFVAGCCICGGCFLALGNRAICDA